MSTQTTTQRLPTAGVELDADVAVPAEPRGIVLFAHGRGSSRHSPRNRTVADALHERNLGSVLVDLRTADDDETGDVELQAKRLGGCLEWLADRYDAPLGLFGAGTGAAAALVCAAGHPDLVGAIVSRGGRPDLAGSALGSVRAPTLLLVGSHDEDVIELNLRARSELTAHTEIVIVPGATHLFAEPGTLAQVAEHAAEWFGTHLPG